MNGFSTAIGAALKAARSLKSESILYDDGNGAIALSAAVGATVFRQSEANGISRLTRTVDFLIDPLDLQRDGEPIAPDEGHTITRVATQENHELLPVGDEPCWRWSDTGQTQYRLHTQKTGDA